MHKTQVLKEQTSKYKATTEIERTKHATNA
jgi:hypothetical protein